MAEPVAGTEYSPTIQAIPTDNASKIEVTELFWYGCPHCYAMDPLLNAWVKKLPADVYFKRVPGIPRPDWAPMAKAFYAMEALGLTEKLHSQLFDAIHKQHVLRPDDEKGTIDWITKQSGLDKKKVEEAFNSFSSNTKLNRAVQVFRASGATGVPSLIIDGKYLTSSTMAGNNEAALKVADFLIEKARQEKAAKH
jgi:thiol:disulfide interchange protein DsbA